MDWKVKKENVSTYNPLEYSQQQMEYTYDNAEVQNQTQDALDQETMTLQEELTVPGMVLLDDQEMKQPIPFAERVKKTKSFARKQAASVSKTWKLFGNSDEMDAIIKMVNGLNAMLEGPVPRTADDRIDVDQLKKKQLKGYDAAISACNYYLETKNPRYSWGIRRYRRVEAMKKALERESELLQVVVSNIGDQRYRPEELAAVQTPRDLLDHVRSAQAIELPELQMEGNSTDVYRIKLNINGKEGYYYFKQNLKPVGDDLSGFVDRRLRQLTNSEKNIGNSAKEEARLHGRIDKDDYKYGKDFLTAMQTSINSVKDSVRDTKALNKRLLTFLGHDFDQVFKDLAVYNAKAKESKRKELDLRERIATAQNLKNAELEAAAKNQLKLLKVSEPLNEYQWLVKLSKDKQNPLGLDLKKDRALFNILEEMSKKDDKTLSKEEGANHRISRFFTRTLGKEIEAYGQQKERSNASNDEVMAKNNTATYRIANLFGFNDVVTSSESAVVNMPLVGSQVAEDVSGTISVEAPGLEMLRLVEIAEQQGKKIHYSPNAIRQIIRLQMFDTTTMQTDRHWRNFKCMTEPDLRNWDGKTPLTKDITIESIGAYDHDMSFGNVDLKEAFKNKNDPNGPSVKNGMLPPVLRKVKKLSAENQYFQTRFMGALDLNIFDKMEMPIPAKGSGYEKTHTKNSKNGFYQRKAIPITDIPDYKKLPKKIIVKDDGVTHKKSVEYYEYNGKLLEKYKDTFYLCDDNGEREGLNILDKNLKTEVNVGLGYMKGTKVGEMLDTCKMLIGGQAVEYGLSKLITHCSYELAEALYKGDSFDDKGGRKLTELEHEAQVNVIKNAILLYNALGKIDVTDNAYEKENVSFGTGYIEFRIRAVIYSLKLQLDAMNPVEKEKLISEAKNKAVTDNAKNIEKDAKKNDKKGEKKEADEYVEVPTLLHMDEEAYLEIVNMNERFDTDVKYALQDLGWNAEKIQKFKDRISQQLEDIEKCRVMAEKILAKKYPKEDDPLRHFLLKKEDYKKVTDIRDIAWDPGMSYFATEDESYLMSDETYAAFLTDNEKKTKLENTNEHRKIERLHGLKQNLTKYDTMIDGRVTQK